MSGQAIRFDLHTDPDTKVFSFALSRYADSLDDMSELFEAFSPVFTSSMKKQFTTQGSYGSGGWKTLSPAYKAWKLKNGLPGVVGTRYGHLKAAMTGGAGYTVEATKSTASYGVGGGPSADYGRHFDRTRPVIRIPQGASGAWGKAAHKWMADQARESGWGRL